MQSGFKTKIFVILIFSASFFMSKWIVGQFLFHSYQNALLLISSLVVSHICVIQELRERVTHFFSLTPLFCESQDWQYKLLLEDSSPVAHLQNINYGDDISVIKCTISA